MLIPKSLRHTPVLFGGRVCSSRMITSFCHSTPPCSRSTGLHAVATLDCCTDNRRHARAGRACCVSSVSVHGVGQARAVLRVRDSSTVAQDRQDAAIDEAGQRGTLLQVLASHPAIQGLVDIGPGGGCGKCKRAYQALCDLLG